jgi:hypothetical protein
MCGDGPGTATFIDFDGPDVTCTADGSPLCNAPIFGVDCTAYNGTISISLGRFISVTTPQALTSHMSRLGLSGITHIFQDLLLVLPAGGDDDPALVLSLFDELIYIGGTLAVDVQTSGFTSRQISRQFVLSSLQKVSHIGGNLNICNTRLKDLSMFGALTCVGRALGSRRSDLAYAACPSSNCHTNGQILLSGNAELATLNGLQLLRSVTRSIMNRDGSGGSDLSAVTRSSDGDASALMDISAISRLGHCTAGAQISTRVRITAAACPGATFRTWPQVCTYISSKKCPSTDGGGPSPPSPWPWMNAPPLGPPLSPSPSFPTLPPHR